jgi:predicted aspartyl protease
MNKPGLAYSVVLAMLVLWTLTAMTVAMASAPDEEGWIVFDASSGHIRIEAAVNGEPASIILDSGADMGAVSEALSKRAGIGADRRQPIQVSGIYDQHRVFGSHEFELELNGSRIPLRGIPVVPSDQFDLLIGRWLFEQTVVQIDYPNQRIRFLDRDAVNFEGNVRTRRGWRGEMLVKTRVNGNRAWLQLDTGNGGLTQFTRSFVRRHDLDEQAIDSIELVGGGVIRTGRLHLLQIDEVEIGPIRIADFAAGYNPDPNRGLDERYQATGSRVRRQRTQFDGLLGFEVMRNFVVTTDFRNGKLHLYLP